MGKKGLSGGGRVSMKSGRHAAAERSASPETAAAIPVPESRLQATAVSSGSAAEEPAIPPREGGQESVTVDRRGEHAAVCRWTVSGFPRVKARTLWSRYFEVGGYDCRLLIYPKGDGQALPGYFSIYLQIVDPRGSSSSSNKWDCLVSYRLSVVNLADESKSITRDSWHRFSSRKKSHGWCDFIACSSLLDSRSGFLSPPPADSIVVTADVIVLHESVSFSRDPDPASTTTAPDAASGKFTWKVHNFSLFREMIKTQKIMSPAFPAGECNFRFSVYQSSVGGVEHLSLCLESKDTEKAAAGVAALPERSCWCLFRMSVLNQRQGSNHVHRDSHSRFASDNKGGDNTSLGWTDFMRMSEFLALEMGFLVDDTVVFSTSFHVIKESSSFSRALVGGRGQGSRKSDSHFGKFIWRIENFTRIKDLLKKKKITGLCIKSRRFQIGNRDCRLIVYPRGQSQPPCHLSVFLEVTDSRTSSNDWSCFVSHRLSLVNQRIEEKSITKESQNRYSKAAKDWGWREFVTLTSLYDQDSGFLVQDTIVFSAEVLILKETLIMLDFSEQESESSSTCSSAPNDSVVKVGSFTWKVENFMSFKEIMETRKIFSKFFQVGGCELRIGVYESFDTICIYLESDQSSGSDPDKNFWVHYRMAVVNHRNPAKSVWKESSICTKTWNNSVLQFMKVSDILEAEAGFLVRDTVVFVCEVIDCCPWFEFSDLEVLASEDDQDALSTDPDELIDSEDSEVLDGDEEDMFRNILSRVGYHLTYGDNPSQLQVSLREKLFIDAGAIAGFLAGLRVYLDDPAKAKRLLLPAKLAGAKSSKKDATRDDSSSPSLMNLLMGVKVLQQAIVDLLLDIMVECCQPSESSTGCDSSDASLKPSPDSNGASTPPETNGESEVADYSRLNVFQRLETGINEIARAFASQNSDLDASEISVQNLSLLPICPPETSSGDIPADDSSLGVPKAKCSEKSEELLILILNSLRALDNVVPQGCPEPRRRPQSVQKLTLVLDKAPRHLLPDVVSLVPKLADRCEHSLAACKLVDLLQPDADTALLSEVFNALSLLEVGSEISEQILFRAFEVLADSNDESLVAATSFIFKSDSLNAPQAVRAIRSRLKCLGAEAPHGTLDVLAKAVQGCSDVAEAFLRDVDSDCELDGNFVADPCCILGYGVSGLSVDGVHLSGQVMHGCQHMSDVYILIEMLSIPGLLVEVSQTFEKAILRGAISLQLVAMVLERRQGLNFKSRSVISDSQSKKSISDGKMETLSVQEGDFTTVLALGEVFSLSRDSRIHDFVRMLYAIMFKIYPDENFRVQMLKALVDRAVSTTDNNRVVDIDMDVLVFLVREEDGVGRPVLSMMRDVSELAQTDRAALWHQVCAVEDENLRLREETQTKISNFAQERATLNQKLNESEATINHIKAELRNEMDRFSREKKDLSEQIIDAENQLEWVRSEKDEKIAKLSADRRVLQDRLNDAETQLSQLKSRKRDELKRIVKEKNALAERLKNGEVARRRFDEELKRFATETVTREEVRQSLEDEVRRLTQTVGQTEGEKREKEEHIARCEAYIDGIESKLQTCTDYIQELEGSLHEEMSRHAPLYGVGLEALSLTELETVSRIHEEGLRHIRAIQHMKAGGNALGAGGSGRSLPMFPTAPPPVSAATTGLTANILPSTNCMALHSNGHMTSGDGNSSSLWFNPTQH